MKNSYAKRKLTIEQFDQKIEKLKLLEDYTNLQGGWIHNIRSMLNISLRQLGKKLDITPQSVRAIEIREKNGSITLKSLAEIAEVLDLKLIYALIPSGGSLESIVEKAAFKAAEKIVMRTSLMMKLEDQENSTERLRKAIQFKAEEIKREMPRYIWD